jgi:hypothetical protein
MKSKKILILTLTSIFIIISIFITVLFLLLNMYNKNYYSSVLKSKTEKLSKYSEPKKEVKSSIKPYGKVNFLLGDLKIKRRKDKHWSKLAYGDKLMRGDSIRIGSDSKIEITLKNGEEITLEGFQKIRIDGSIISLSEDGGNGSSGKSGKMSRLTGKEDKDRETTPVSAIRSKPAEGNKDNLKTKIGE